MFLKIWPLISTDEGRLNITALIVTPQVVKKTEQGMTPLAEVVVTDQLFVVWLQDCEFDPLKYNSIIECEKPNNDLNRFRGYM